MSDTILTKMETGHDVLDCCFAIPELLLLLLLLLLTMSEMRFKGNDAIKFAVSAFFLQK